MSLELKTKLVDYLNKKGIEVCVEEYERLIWTYKPHFSSFRIILEFDKKDSSDDFYTIKYYVSNHSLEGIRKRRTKTSKNFQYSVYVNLTNIKSQLDLIAIEQKTKIDSINQYCSELSSHYCKIHNKIDININQSPVTSGEQLSINIIANDNHISTYYTIVLKDNKYYLTNKTQVINKYRNTENLLEPQLSENQDN